MTKVSVFASDKNSQKFELPSNLFSLKIFYFNSYMHWTSAEITIFKLWNQLECINTVIFIGCEIKKAITASRTKSDTHVYTKTRKKIPTWFITQSIVKDLMNKK